MPYLFDRGAPALLPAARKEPAQLLIPVPALPGLERLATALRALALG